MDKYSRPWLDKISPELIRSINFGLRVMPINVEYINEETEEMTKSQSKFAVGDKLVCVRESLFSNEDFMFFGRYYIVSGCDESFVEFEGKKNYRYPVGAFVLVSPTFKNMKFRVNSPEHSKEIQEALFEMGYVWKSYGNKEMFTEDAGNYDWLYTTQDGCIWLGNNSYKGVISAQEFKVETTKSYKLIPVETPKENPKEIITIDGKTYDKEAVLKRLAELVSI